MHRVGPNCSFEIDDAEQEWLYGPNSFDFIHNRNFVCAIRNWERLVGQAFRYVLTGHTILDLRELILFGTAMSSQAGGSNGTRNTPYFSAMTVL